jgi:two-component system NarL family sensor kinase
MASQTSIYLTLITGLGVLTVLLVLFGISLFRNQRKSMNDYKDNVMREIAVIELERKRIAADLHDELGSSLAAVRLGIESLCEAVPEEKIGNRTIHALERSIVRLKEISLNLSPKVLHARGLIAAIREIEAEVNSTGKIQLVLSCQFDDSNTKPENAILLFRVFQEIIGNALKHAKATRVEMQLREIKNELFIRITDNGIGFDPFTEKADGKNSGLGNIRSRMEILNGSLKLHSVLGKGTKYSMKIPLSSLT